MDGVLLIDKPSGPTSHDVVARLRSVCGERSVGHTGTLDPRATGLLPIVFGKATRIASVLTGGDKTYEATIHFGVTTDTDDADGRIIGTSASLPGEMAIDAALEAFRGTFDQTPPAHSAKKIGGHKAYDLARRDEAVELKPVSVTVKSLERTAFEAGMTTLRVTVSSGFYVRALARDLGEALGCGAHLHALRRTHVGRFDLSASLPLAVAERLGPAVSQHVMSPAEALDDLAAVTVTEAGLRRAVHGNPLNPEHFRGRSIPVGGVTASRIRVLALDGRLVALAAARGGALHPIVVLG
jgi:tRNA pseudouridine55 synthase